MQNRPPAPPRDAATKLSTFESDLRHGQPSTSDFGDLHKIRGPEAALQRLPSSASSYRVHAARPEAVAGTLCRLTASTTGVESTAVIWRGCSRLSSSTHAGMSAARRFGTALSTHCSRRPKRRGRQQSDQTEVPSSSCWWQCSQRFDCACGGAAAPLHRSS